MTKTIITAKPEVNANHESDGRFALQLRTNKAVQRMMRRDAEREARRQQIIAENGSDDLLWA
jgi:hypothetical protein